MGDAMEVFTVKAIGAAGSHSEFGRTGWSDVMATISRLSKLGWQRFRVSGYRLPEGKHIEHVDSTGEWSVDLFRSGGRTQARINKLYQVG